MGWKTSTGRLRYLSHLHHPLIPDRTFHTKSLCVYSLSLKIAAAPANLTTYCLNSSQHAGHVIRVVDDHGIH